jgi:transcriptional regulator with XRE-family HTH domain
MIVNQRIRQIREHKRLRSQELATMAGLSASAISLLEKQMRTPKVDTLQRIAAALEVSTSYLLGEEDTELALSEALSRQSLKIFLRRNKVSKRDRGYLETVSSQSSAPQAVRGWADLISNVRFYGS